VSAFVAALALACGGLAAPPDSALPRPAWEAGVVAQPRVFAEGIVSTEDDESNGSFSSDGNEYVFTKFNPYTTMARWGLLCVSRHREGRWSEPEVLPFSGRNLDFTPRFSPDGRTLFFASSRPAPGKTARTVRIWSAARTASGWEEPRVLPAPINAPDDDWNYAPSVTRDGTLYFASTRDGSGRAHVYRARFVDGAYRDPEKLGPAINSEFTEDDPYVSADERVLIFSSKGEGLPTDRDRPETIPGGGVRYPRGDLYASLSSSGEWSPARHLEASVNTFAEEGAPSLTPDGKYLFFTSERSSFSVPPARRLSAREIDAAMKTPFNGRGNVYFISVESLGLPGSGTK
jgi:hypothetical protein